MHEKYGKDGLAALSVSLDDPKEDPKAREKVLKFLQDRGATFPNLMLDEDSDVWQVKLKISGPPCVYLFDRDNHYVLKMSDDSGNPRVDYAVIEKKITELLKK